MMEKQMKNKENFYLELEQLINKYSMENNSDTPDFLLADYLMECLEVYSHAIKNRDTYYTFNPNKGVESTL